MSEGPRDEARIREPKDGGGMAKWLLGGAVAVLLLGGGYFALKAANPDPAEVAHNDPQSAEPVGTGALYADEASNIAADESDAAPAEARAAPRNRAETIPEVTIGVTPAHAVASGGEAEGQDSDEIVVTAPHTPIWSRTPSARRLSSMYPERALERGREGEARLHCVVQAGGALDCERMSETPGGGFGVAALRVARGFRHAPTLADGADAVGSSVRLRVVFRMEEPPRRRRR